jgi:hypothetical protein
MWANYKLLQVFDRLSLYLCMPPLREHTLGPVPVGGEGREVQLALRPGEGGRVAVTPYPFGQEPLAVEVMARVVPQKKYADDGQFRAALAGAETVVLSYRLATGPPAIV